MANTLIHTFFDASMAPTFHLHDSLTISHSIPKYIKYFQPLHNTFLPQKLIKQNSGALEMAGLVAEAGISRRRYIVDAAFRYEGCLAKVCKLLHLLVHNVTHSSLRSHTIRECSSTLYVGMAHPAPPTNTNFHITFLLTRLLEAP